MKKHAVIVAGGSGTRMGSILPKQFMTILGKPVLWHTVNTFLRSYEDLEVILVLPKEHMKLAGIVVPGEDSKRVVLAEGGPTRFHSVMYGLRYVSKKSIVFVHDGVRCLLTTDLIYRCYDAALQKGNAVPAVKPVDSLRLQTTSGNEIIDRNHVWSVQTPQTFTAEQILPAFDQEYDVSFTDEASVVERLGIKINLVEGENNNIKITKPLDILIAETIMRGSFE